MIRARFSTAYNSGAVVGAASLARVRNPAGSGVMVYIQAWTVSSITADNPIDWRLLDENSDLATPLPEDRYVMIGHSTERRRAIVSVGSSPVSRGAAVWSIWHLAKTPYDLPIAKGGSADERAGLVLPIKPGQVVSVGGNFNCQIMGGITWLEERDA